MGYEYGVWLVYDQNDLKCPQHIGHITLACFMTKQDALGLCKAIHTIIGTHDNVTIHGNDIKYYDKNYYDHDTNGNHSWGYNVTCSNQNRYIELCKAFTCDIPQALHTSIVYNEYMDSSKMIGYKVGVLENVQCRIVTVDIRSSLPCEWKLIDE